MSLITRQAKGSKLTIEEMDGNLTYLEELAQEGGLEGSQYVFVAADGTDIENAAQLQAAYDEAKTMSPSATNRITVIAAPGNYNFETSTFIMDTEFIDLVSLDGNRSIVFNASINFSNRTQGSINITANDVFVKGVDVQDKNFTIGDNLNLLKVENCKGGNLSFGLINGIVSGTFINCVGGFNSFGNSGIASGTFINCVGFSRCFGSSSLSGLTGIASGTFTDCVGGDNSFGYDGPASGTFIGCVGGRNSFGTNGIASGTFTNCKGGDFSFGRSVNRQSFASGIFNNCIGGNRSFGTLGTASGTFTNCVGGNESFGTFGTVLGNFSYCIGGVDSFMGQADENTIFKWCETTSNQQFPGQNVFFCVIRQPSQEEYYGYY